MKILFFCFLFSCATFAQVSPFISYNGYFQTFYKGNVRTLELQPISSFDAGDNVAPYIDNQGNFKIYNGYDVDQITIQYVTYKFSDFLVSWKIGNALYCYDNGVKKMLTINSGEYSVTDSLVVFQDTRFKTLNVYYKGEIIQLMQQTGDLTMPESIGENIIGFKDNGDVYRVFYRGKIYELGGSSLAINFSSGTNILCFNDAINKSFAVFENEEFMDVETQYVKKYKAGRDFIVYEDINGNLFRYSNGNIVSLSNYNSGIWDVKDDIVIWNENNMLYTFFKNTRIKISNFIPNVYSIKNDVIVFQNSSNGLSVILDGKESILTNQLDAKYKILGSTVLVELFNKSYQLFARDGILSN
jgi:hypothetical protein